MRKLTVLLCVALLLCAATATMASESYLVVQMKAGWPETIVGPAYSSTLTIGASPTEAHGNLLMAPEFPVSLTSERFGGYYLTDRLSSGNPPPYEFTLALAVSSSYSHESVYITAWSPETYLTVGGRSLPWNWAMTVQSLDRSTTYGTWTGAQLYGNPSPPGNEAGPVGFWYVPTSRPGSWPEVTDRFHVAIGPVPEPTSLFGLAGGLIGTAGFALRRRKG